MVLQSPASGLTIFVIITGVTVVTIIMVIIVRTTAATTATGLIDIIAASSTPVLCLHCCLEICQYQSQALTKPERGSLRRLLQRRR